MKAEFKISSGSRPVVSASLQPQFSRPEYWSGLPFPSPGDLPNPGIEPRSPTLQADSLLSEPFILIVTSILAQSSENKAQISVLWWQNFLACPLREEGM